MKKIVDVERFWNSNPCESSPLFQNTNIDKTLAFQEIENIRYKNQSEIIKFARFETFKGKKVLEIGCGVGTDGIQFARAGADYTGIDLTNSAIEITSKRFKAFGQRGDIKKVNAEELPFTEASFDHVYSFGVIHHSPAPKKIVDEIYRVLKPGGTATIMLYNKTSFYYQIEVKLIRKLFFYFCDKNKLCKILFLPFKKERVKQFLFYKEKLKKYKETNPKPTAEEWCSMNTDDVFCPIAKVYSKTDAKKLFKDFSKFKTSVWFIDKNNWILWIILKHFIPQKLEIWLESKLGWFRMVEVTK
ncbi:MAG: class I SAM-dependent methyltransferase [Candidatus Kuenenia sp.]|nr:class I SAM-dependent methyltransferase [Candidatus Kuenenia hertensis]